MEGHSTACLKHVLAMEGGFSNDASDHGGTTNWAITEGSLADRHGDTLPKAFMRWSLSTLRDRLAKIGAKIVRHGRSIIFQMAEVMVSRELFRKIRAAIAALRPQPPARC